MATEEAKKAHLAVRKAVVRGEIVRPTVCEVCGIDVVVYGHYSVIVAHHWRGYDHPLDIWWVCGSCNTILGSIHDGSLSKEQARAFVRRNPSAQRRLAEANAMTQPRLLSL